MKILLSIVLMALVFNGCATKKRVISVKKEFPSWYENPMMSTEDTLYAVSEGETKRGAINNALNEILASLSVSISSEFNSKTEVSGGKRQSYQVTSSNEVHSKVQEIKINNYELVHENDFGFEKYLVAVKIQKTKLFLGLKKDLDAKFNTIKQGASKANAIMQLQAYQKNKKDLGSISNTLSVMHALDPNFNDAPYIQKATQIDNNYAKLLSKISFSLHVNTDARNLKPSLEKGLSDKKFHLAKTQSKNHFKVYISSSTSKAKAYGFDLARSSISIQVKDYKGAVIGSNKFNLIGQSTQGYKIAKENVAIKLGALIKREGISQVVGLDI
ncbi:MAG: LPP20 family lipoprotein [Sulfurimonas sp.]|nr:LPP20 family lipoprotein [Sulfurimonas sp.]